MSKFQEGQKVKVLADSQDWTGDKEYMGGKAVGKTGYIQARQDEGEYVLYASLTTPLDGYMGYYYDHELELITSKEGKPMARRAFKLIKETPLKKGAIFQEDCDDGTQPYSLIDNGREFYKGTESTYGDHRVADRSLVEGAPQFFVEVFAVEPQYMTREELDRFEAFKKTLHPTKRKTTKKPAAKKAN